MEKWQREHITRNLDELVDLTTFNSSVKAKLVTQKILCKADVEKLDAVQKQNGDMEASRLYYEKLQTRKGAYKILYEALVETNQSGAYTILIRVPNEVFSKPLTYLGISIKLERFQDTVIEVHGNQLKLYEFFPAADYEKLQQVFKHCLTELDIYDMFVTNERTFVLASNSIPPKPPYYVPRFLSNRIKVEKSIFQEDCPDVFVFKNSIARYQLSQIARPHPTDISSSQLAQITCRFIYLEENEDWYELKKLANGPIHLINYEKNGKVFVLEDSSAPSDILMKLGSGNQRVYMSEEDFVQQQHSKACTSSSVCICDTPGMGKTFLLANIAWLMTEKHVGRIVVFIQLTALAKDYFPAFPNTIIDPETSLANVLGYICPPQQNPELLVNLVKSRLLSLEIFFDGFDEISKDQAEWTKHVFKSITMNFSKVRIYITSRPHMREDLETSLEVVAYDILPFNQQNQLDFLVRYWQNSKPNSDLASLQRYATSCLEAINKSLTKNDKEIAGIPLLCQLIAEVYEDKVEFYLIKRRKLSDNPFKISGMYQKFIEKKINVASNNREEFDDIKLVHIWHALKLHFPTHYFHEESQFKKISHILISPAILKAGILQKHSNASSEFIHRTFAEYLVADYFATKIQDTEMQQTEEMKSSTISTLKLLLKCKPEWDYGFVHPVIAAFFNSALVEINISDELKIQLAKVLSSFSNKEFIYIPRACCQHNLLNVFSFLGEALTKCVKSWIYECFTHENCYQLIKLCIQKSTSQMFHACIQLFTEVLKLDVGQISAFDKDNTLLQIAARHANYAAVEYFVDRVPLKNQSILGTCARYRNDIEKRENILQLLLNKEPTLMHETPDILFTLKLDVRLFKVLVEFGANLSVLDNNGKNCVMRAAEYMTPSNCHELVQFLLTDCKAGFLFLDPEKRSDPLLYIIKRVTLLPETMELLLSIPGMDIRMKDRWKESLLFSAVKADDMRELEQLVTWGVDYNARDRTDRSLLHLAAQLGQVGMVRYLLSLKLDPNSPDEHGFTPLHLAALINNLSVVDVLVENGANVQAENKSGQTALHLSAYYGDSKSIEIVRYLIGKGAEVNDRDYYGNTPLHFCQKKEVIDCLIEMGAAIHATNNEHQTPAQKNPFLWKSSNLYSNKENGTDFD